MPETTQGAEAAPAQQPVAVREKSGRKPWLPNLEQVKGLARRGLNLEQIAYALGIRPETLYRKKKVLAQLNQAINEGRAEAAMRITNRLYEMATEGKVTFAGQKQAECPSCHAGVVCAGCKQPVMVANSREVSDKVMATCGIYWTKAHMGWRDSGDPRISVIVNNGAAAERTPDDAQTLARWLTLEEREHLIALLTTAEARMKSGEAPPERLAIDAAATGVEDAQVIEVDPNDGTEEDADPEDAKELE